MANELFAALVKAQAKMKHPGLDSQNPHFRNRYASLMAVREAVLPVMHEHGISVVQCPVSSYADGKSMAGVKTILAHQSGESMETELLMPVEKANAQGVGSAITYARRYSLLAVAGLVGDPDDDGNEASAPPPKPQREAAPKPKEETPGQVLVREVSAWSGLTAPTDVNAAARGVMAKAGVVVEKGGKLTAEQAKACGVWMSKHRFEELN